MHDLPEPCDVARVLSDDEAGEILDDVWRECDGRVGSYSAPAPELMEDVPLVVDLRDGGPSVMVRR